MPWPCGRPAWIGNGLEKEAVREFAFVEAVAPEVG
jgi:hypothetical protein